MHIYIPLCLIIYLELYYISVLYLHVGGAGQSPEAETTEAVVGGHSGRDREQAFSDALRGVVAVVQRRDARVADLPHLDLRHLVGDRRLEAPRVAQLAALRLGGLALSNATSPRPRATPP